VFQGSTKPVSADKVENENGAARLKEKRFLEDHDEIQASEYAVAAKKKNWKIKLQVLN